MSKNDTTSDETRLDRFIHQLGIKAENAVDEVRERFRQKIGHSKPMKIIAFHGMGNNTTCRMSGRVLEYTDTPVDDPDSIWQNLQDSYRRFETDEVPDIEVCLCAEGKNYHTRTDDEGYFTFEFPRSAAADKNTTTVDLSLPEYLELHEKTTGTIFFATSQAAFGVISDIDDTIMITQATSLIKMMRLTLLESSTSRIPFAGVSAFYHALRADVNPFFYVSSSPWNLFEFLVDFMRINNIAAGPLLLRDFGIDKTKLIAGPHKTHKLAQIRSVIDFYPELSFILIGDSGQHDPEIYADVVTDYPGRILAVYIRDVGHAARDRQVQKLASSLQKKGVDMLLVPDTLAATIHAASKGFISESEASTAIVADEIRTR